MAKLSERTLLASVQADCAEERTTIGAANELGISFCKREDVNDDPQVRGRHPYQTAHFSILRAYLITTSLAAAP
jgi:hypothetical protein